MTQQQDSLSTLEETLEYTFADRSLLETALTHTSFVKVDGKRHMHNERLEFLGDAVLELCVSEHLYLEHPELQEGAMTRHRARLVCEHALFSAATTLGIPAYLRLGNGEELTGGRNKPSIVSDALEAIIGAIFLDGGIINAKRVILERIATQIGGRCISCGNREGKTLNRRRMTASDRLDYHTVWREVHFVW